MAKYIEKRINNTYEFISSIRNMKENTLNFENICVKERYKNDGIPYMNMSEKNLIYMRNIILDKYINRVIEKRKINRLNDDQIKRYDLNPYLAAHELLGNQDYWWLILLVNKKLNVHDFTKLHTMIYTPDMFDLKECLKKEFNKNKDLDTII